MRRIEKKTWPKEFQAVLDGKKTFDARIADFKISEGDILILREWDPKTKKYTGRKLEKRVGFILKTKDAKFWKKKDIENFGLQIIGFK